MTRAGRVALITVGAAAGAYLFMQAVLALVVSTLAAATPGHAAAHLSFGLRNMLGLILAFVVALRVLEARADEAWKRRRRRR